MPEEDDDSKVCGDCGESKPLSSFYSSPRGVKGVGTYCRSCANKRSRENWPKYSEDFKVKRRASHLLRKYGMTVDEYDLLLADQNGVCSICKQPPPPGWGRLHVDHDHACCPGDTCCGNCIRGLLCNRCNLHLRDDPEWHRAAIEYLATHEKILPDD